MPNCRRPSALGCRELRSEHQHRAEDGEQHHGHQSDELHLEFGELGAGVEDLVGEVPGEEHALGQQKRREGVADVREEAHAAASIRMRRLDEQFNARHVPEEPRPDEQAKVPAQKQELEERQAYGAQPPPGQRRPPFASDRFAVPARHVERRLRTPDEPDSDDVDEGNQEDLRCDRIPQAQRRGHRRVELRTAGLRNQAALEKLPHHRAHALVNHQFRHDQQRQREQQTQVHVHIEEEWDSDLVPPGASSRHRQQQQRHPRH